MPINLRGAGVIPDGSITEAKLANNAVSAAKIQTDAVIADKIAANAVIADKIATDAVTTTKIADDAVSPAKVTADLGIQHFLGYETELTHTGTTETTIAEFNFQKTSNFTENWQTLGYMFEYKSNDSANSATVSIYIDGVQVATHSTTATSFEIETFDMVDLSALTHFKHLVEIKFSNSQATGVTTLSRLDVYLGKKPI